MLPYEVFVEEQEHDNDGHDHEHEQSNVETQTREPDSPLCKLHCINKFGHPANNTLARTLRLRGAKPEIVEAAKRIKCDSCDRARAPKDPARVGATSYHLLRHMPKRSGKEGATLCAEAWIGTFGARKELVYDQGSELRTDLDEFA